MKDLPLTGARSSLRFPLTRALLAHFFKYNVLGGRGKSLFLGGPTRTGKTAWARSLEGEHVYWNGLINADTWNEKAKYIVIDDFDWTYFPCKKQLIGCQHEFTLTDKYRKKRRISNWGKPCIFIFNPDMDPYQKMSASELEWIRGNSIRIDIVKPLF